MRPTLDENGPGRIRAINLHTSTARNHNPRGFQINAQLDTEHRQHDPLSGTLFTRMPRRKITVHHRGSDGTLLTVDRQVTDKSVVQTYDQLIHDLEIRSLIPADQTLTLQHPANLIHLLPGPHLRPLRQFIVIESTSRSPQNIQNTITVRPG